MNPTQASRWEWVFRACLTGLVSLGVWFGSRVFASLEEARAEISSLKNELAIVTASRFTSTDWINAKNTLDLRDNEITQRVALLERDLNAIQKSVDKVGLGVEDLQQKFFSLDFSKLPAIRK